MFTGVGDRKSCTGMEDKSSSRVFADGKDCGVSLGREYGSMRYESSVTISEESCGRGFGVLKRMPQP